jgi:hypothetical protein
MKAADVALLADQRLAGRNRVSRADHVPVKAA